MEYTFRIPGKTFLLGEYAVLKQAPALVFCHEPYYEFSVSTESKSGMQSVISFFHPASPAGILVQRMDSNKQNLFIKCEHAYGRGGFGLSTAEFWVASQILWSSDMSSLLLPLETDQAQLLQNYWSMFEGQPNKKPSGADLQAQSVGGFCYVDQKHGRLRRIAWPFAKFQPVIVQTGNKLKTHEHLNQMGSLDFSELVMLCGQLENCFAQSQDQAFVQLVQDYGNTLESLGLLLAETKVLQNELRKISGVLATKGCGAMGADSLLLLCETSEVKAVHQKLQQMDLRFFDQPALGGHVL